MASFAFSPPFLASSSASFLAFSARCSQRGLGCFLLGGVILSIRLIAVINLEDHVFKRHELVHDFLVLVPFFLERRVVFASLFSEAL